ncbi:hypothetical protein BU23DRAFT_233193 [Bimuria novae-zelandiae CBS 107.79]|uniref:Uncharacterized protein n=1 Tax=Bimuria novae-zelandiae CBS 107.79 TaxID=1447943 RepID=A0A6A5UZ64_9PLEO|nr:hypothetical protein BU23DRAFT_233193 [Bimuria novae-zelandiae CBS 107.79]
MVSAHEQVLRSALVRYMLSLHPYPNSNPPPPFLWLEDPSRALNPTWASLVQYAGSLALWQETRISALRSILESLGVEAAAYAQSYTPAATYQPMEYWTKESDIIAAFPNNLRSIVTRYLFLFPRGKPDTLPRVGADRFFRYYMEQRGLCMKGEFGKTFGKEVEQLVRSLEMEYREAVLLRGYLGL